METSNYDSVYAKYTIAQLKEMINDSKHGEVSLLRSIAEMRFMKSWELRREQLPTFTTNEVLHIVQLNCKLVELQYKVLTEINSMTFDIQGLIAQGKREYEGFHIEGYITLDVSDEWYNDENFPQQKYLTKLIDITPDFTDFLYANDEASANYWEEFGVNYIHWGSNYGGYYKALISEYNTPVCRAFRHFAEDCSLFTVEDLMLIQPELFFTGVRICI